MLGDGPLFETEEDAIEVTGSILFGTRNTSGVQGIFSHLRAQSLCFRGLPAQTHDPQALDPYASAFAHTFLDFPNNSPG